MSNGTRKKVVDFKKLLVIDEDNVPVRKKTVKLNGSNKNSINKKDKNSKIGQKQRENNPKAPEKPSTKKQKCRNFKKKEQLSLSEFTNKLNSYKEEIAFLQKKRNADINIEKILSFQKKCQNKGNSALNINDNKSSSKTKKNENLKDDNINTAYNIQNKNNNEKGENENENSTLIIDFYKLYYHLFDSNRLDNSKPYKFVDYLIAGDLLLFNLKKDKLKFEEIKKGISIKPKNNSLINEHLLNKSIYEFLRCDFTNSFMKKLSEKINVFLMNRYTNKKKEKNSVENSIDKKDKFTYSNFLADKLKDNTNKSFLSFTNDTEYFKSLIYVCNKYSKYIGKKEIPEKILIESLEKNKKILENFKISESEKASSKEIETGYLKDLLHNKPIRKYISKKLRIFNDDILENNEILKSLNINNFYKIMNIMIKNKNDDDLEKLYKLFEEEIKLDNNEKLDKNNLKYFIILFKFLFELLILNQISNENSSGQSNNIINNISFVKEIYEKLNIIQSINSQKSKESGNKIIHKTRRNRIKIKENKSLKELTNIDKEQKNNDNNSNDKDKTNKIIGLNENDINNNIELKTNKKNIKDSKIIPFKIPFSVNNNNKPNNTLFEINNKIEIKNNNSTQIKADDSNKDKIIFTEKTHFETYNESHFEANENLKEKENIKTKKKRKRHTEENKENLKNIKTDENGRKSENIENNLLNKFCVTFYTINQNTRDLNIGKYLLNKLSSGEDVFKLVIEKPKIKRNKGKEISEHSNSKEKESKIENDNENKENNNNNKKRRRRRIKKEKTNEEDIKDIDEFETKLNKEEEKNIDIKNVKIIEIEEEQKEKKEEDEILNNKEINIKKKENETREDSKSDKKNDKAIDNKYLNIKNLDSNIFINFKDDKERNIDTIHFNNLMIQDGEIIKEITRNNLKHSPNICIKISQKIIKPNDKNIVMDEEIKEDINHKKNNDKIFNINYLNSKYMFSTNKNHNNNIIETKYKIRKNKKESFKNINIQIERQSVEIKGGNVILNNERDIQN